MADKLHTAYWAAVPAPVRHDKELRPNAKLLYAEISALCNAHGYCWATNEALAKLFGVGGKTISELVGQLEKRGYVAVELIRDEKGRIRQRRIRLRETVPSDLPREQDFEQSSFSSPHPLPKNRDTSPEKSGEECIEKNDIPPYIPPGGQRGKVRPKWEPEIFERLWTLYPNHKSRQAAVKAWDKLKPTRELQQVMSWALRRQMASDLWRRGIGIPYLSTWINQRRWEDEDEDEEDTVVSATSAEARPTEEVPLL